MGNESLIERNARELRRIYFAFRDAFETFGHSSPEHLAALAIYRDRRDSLEFPGGYERGLASIAEGSPEAIEDALTLLEVRPYYNHSQYVFDVLLRKVKSATLNADQRERLRVVLTARALRGDEKRRRRAKRHEPCERCGHSRGSHSARRGCASCSHGFRCALKFEEPPLEWSRDGTAKEKPLP